MTILFRIEDSQVHLLGSVHVTNIDNLKLPRHVDDAFEVAKQIFFETDLDADIDRSIFELAADRSLIDIVPGNIHQAVLSHCVRLGLSENLPKHFYPVFTAMILQLTAAEQKGYQSHLGIDRHLWERARVAGKLRHALEGADDQLRKLATSPMEEQISFLDHISANEELHVHEIEGMVSAWVRADDRFFEKILLQRKMLWPRTFDILISQRNRDWLPALLSMARSGDSILVVVGFLHLLGPTGLPELLRNAGLSVCIEGRSNF